MSVAAGASDNVGVAGVQFRLDGAVLGAEDTQSPFSVSWDTTTAANGSHSLTAVARDAAGNSTTSAAVSVTVQNSAPPPSSYLVGNQQIETKTDSNPAGNAEAFREVAASSGTLTKLTVYVDPLSGATQLTAGIYSDSGGHPGTLLGQGTLNAPVAGSWNEVSVPATSITGGTTYWIAILSPSGTGTIRFRDRCCGGGSPVETSSQTTLTALPGAWTTGARFSDGPASVWGGGSGVALPPADQVGRWSAPISWPIVAVHMILLPTGNILMFDGFDAGPNSERIWNPTTGTFTPVPYGRNLFCAGHVTLADGRTLIIGGHISANLGLADTTIYDPSTGQWTRPPDMSVGRWYPTATELPDGRVLAFSGDNIVLDRPGQLPPFSDASVNSLPSVFDPATNLWTDLNGARLTSPLYPFMFVLSNGKVFDAGPDTTTRILDPATWTWSVVGTSPIDGHSAVMYRPEQDHEVRSLGRPGLQRGQRVLGDWSDGRHRHEPGVSGLARDRPDAVPALVPQPDAAARRLGARHRRRHDVRRSRSDQGGPAGRDLEPGHGDLDDRRRRAERTSVPLDGHPPARRPRADGRWGTAAELRRRQPVQR